MPEDLALCDLKGTRSLRAMWDDIRSKRLPTLPWAALCIACQEELDRDRQESKFLHTIFPSSLAASTEAFLALQMQQRC
jgi:hypothetical protein